MSTDALESVDLKELASLFSDLDPSTLLPKITDLTSFAVTVCRLCILLVPLALLLVGLAYLLFAPKEANYYFGYRTAFGMGSVSAWRHTQKVAGAMFALLGLVLLLGMFLYSAGMGSMEPMNMVWSTIGCLALEGVLVIAARFLVNTVAMVTFNFRGERRWKRKSAK